jgi:predicted ATPase
MLKELHIHHFKSHKDTTLHLSGLNVLCGQNGVGKSSVIQSLLLLKQTYDNKQLDKVLNLNKPLCYIGKAKDALYQKADTDTLSFRLIEDDFDGFWSYEVQNLTYDYLKLIAPPIEKDALDKSFLNKPFIFLSASRLGSTENYISNDFAVENGQLSLERGRGELTAQFLYIYRTKAVIEGLKHPSEPDSSLLEQVTAWEREISKGVNVVPVKEGNDYKIKFSFNTPDGKTDEFNAENVGFGLSYILPLLVAILSADKGSLILIENPEAHLHPNGVAKLTELMCLAAQSGIQIILETHSDHVINGILVQCKQFEEAQNGIARQNVAIYHFDRDDTKHCTDVKAIKIEENGFVRYTPKGFFDQFTIDRKYLMGF